MTNKENYIRQETVTGVVPMLKKDRQYSFLDLFLSTSGFAIATWCYTQGAYVAQYLSFSRMLINIFCFNIVWVLIECLPVIFASRYGIDLWIWLRSVLGKKGVAILSTVISVANFGWYAVAAGLFSSSMINLAGKFGIVLDKDLWGPILGCLRRPRHVDRFGRTECYQMDEPLPGNCPSGGRHRGCGTVFYFRSVCGYPRGSAGSG